MQQKREKERKLVVTYFQCWIDSPRWGRPLSARRTGLARTGVLPATAGLARSLASKQKNRENALSFSLLRFHRSTSRCLLPLFRSNTLQTREFWNLTFLSLVKPYLDSWSIHTNNGLITHFFFWGLHAIEFHQKRLVPWLDSLEQNPGFAAVGWGWVTRYPGRAPTVRGTLWHLPIQSTGQFNVQNFTTPLLKFHLSECLDCARRGEKRSVLLRCQLVRPLPKSSAENQGDPRLPSNFGPIGTWGQGWVSPIDSTKRNSRCRTYFTKKEQPMTEGNFWGCGLFFLGCIPFLELPVRLVRKLSIVWEVVTPALFIPARHRRLVCRRFCRLRAPPPDSSSGRCTPAETGSYTARPRSRCHGLQNRVQTVTRRTMPVCSWQGLPVCLTNGYRENKTKGAYQCRGHASPVFSFQVGLGVYPWRQRPRTTATTAGRLREAVPLSSLRPKNIARWCHGRCKEIPTRLFPAFTPVYFQSWQRLKWMTIFQRKHWDLHCLLIWSLILPSCFSSGFSPTDL